MNIVLEKADDDDGDFLLFFLLFLLLFLFFMFAPIRFRFLLSNMERLFFIVLFYSIYHIKIKEVQTILIQISSQFWISFGYKNQIILWIEYWIGGGDLLSVS